MVAQVLHILDAEPIDAVAQLNAVAVTPAQLQEGANSDDPRVESAIAGRKAAIEQWSATHDPQAQSNRQATIEAAARFPLSPQPDGIGFEPAGFQEMILFIEELPW